MDTALPQKFPFILDRNLAKAIYTENRVCTSCDIVVLIYRGRNGLTVGIHIDFGFVFEEEFEDVEGAALGAVVQGRVALHAFPVDVGPEPHKVLGDGVVALVARDHEARVPVSVGDLHVCKPPMYPLKYIVALMQ